MIKKLTLCHHPSSRCNLADNWFLYFPLLGNEMQYVLVIPGLAWFAGDGGGIARRFTLVTYISTLIVNSAKDALCLPRPPHKLHVWYNKHVAEQYGECLRTHLLAQPLMQ